MRRVRHLRTVCVSIVLMLCAVAAFSKREDCGVNVSKVVAVDFTGPIDLPRWSHGSYDLTINVEKKNAAEPASLCYVVYERDPWWKVLWGRDDVLAEGKVSVPADQSTWTIPGVFSLVNVDGRVCGNKWAPTFSSPDGEHVVEVFVRIVDASGTGVSATRLIQGR